MLLICIGITIEIGEDMIGKRGSNGFIDALGSALGIDKNALDDLFIAAKSIQ